MATRWESGCVDCVLKRLEVVEWMKAKRNCGLTETTD